MSAQTQLFPKREAVQLLKDRLQAWCKEENRREQKGVTLQGSTPSGEATSERRQKESGVRVAGILYLVDCSKV